MIRQFLAAVLTAFLATIGLATGAMSADFTFVSAERETQLDDGQPFTACTFRMTGKIIQGDFDKFEAFVAQHQDLLGDGETLRIATLCLDSPGGSLTEAVKIAESIRKDRPFPIGEGTPILITRLEANAHCASACAIIFMAGTRPFFEEDSIPARSMHPTARLGFHAPALPIAEG